MPYNPLEDLKTRGLPCIIISLGYSWFQHPHEKKFGLANQTFGSAMLILEIVGLRSRVLYNPRIFFLDFQLNSFVVLPKYFFLLKFLANE